MSIDERLEALTMSLELLSHDVQELRDAVHELRQAVHGLVQAMTIQSGNIGKLYEISVMQNQRITRLEDKL